MGVLRLKELMRLKEFSRDELASKGGVSATTISNINSEKNLPTIQLLLSIAEALDVDVRDMFESTKGSVSQSEINEARELINAGLSKLK